MCLSPVSWLRSEAGGRTGFCFIFERVYHLPHCIMETSKPSNIQERTFYYAVRIVNLFRALDLKRSENTIPGKQLLRSGTAVGALCQEAISAESRADFLHKYSIALKEARESLYWLRLLIETKIIPENRSNDLIKETDEIIRILVVITRKLKKK